MDPVDSQAMASPIPGEEDWNADWGLGPELPKPTPGAESDMRTPPSFPALRELHAGSPMAPTDAAMGEDAEQLSALLGLPDVGLRDDAEHHGPPRG
jgi:hypothetical protein